MFGTSRSVLLTYRSATRDCETLVAARFLSQSRRSIVITGSREELLSASYGCDKPKIACISLKAARAVGRRSVWFRLAGRYVSVRGLISPPTTDVAYKPGLACPKASRKARSHD